MNNWSSALSILAIVLSLTSCQQRKVKSGRDVKSPEAPARRVQFEGHSYQAFEGKVSWQEARKRCEKMGGYLCCIESEAKAEQKFVAALANGKYLYLGGTDEAKEGEWTWINGSPFVYTCWMGGQPSNWGGDENYLATYDEGEWVDVAAGGDGFWMPTGFICEWEGKRE